MTNLDMKLLSLRVQPPDPRLNTLEDMVLHELSVRRNMRMSRQQIMMTATLALMIGVAGSILPGKDMRVPIASDALTGTPALAPSQLLGR